MKPVRIQMRLYPNRPNDAIVLEWIDSLPVTETGRRQVKDEIVTLIAEALRNRGKSKRRRPHVGARKKSGRKREAKITKKPVQEEPAAKPVRSNGAQKPKVDNPTDKLPEFPAVDSIGF